MDLSVIILNHNGKQYLKDCLSSIFKNTHNITYEVILVDNASTDGSVGYVKGRFPKVKVIENKENVGFTKGNNIGVGSARGKYVCILNNDTIILPDALNNLVDFMRECPNIIATGKVLNFDGTPQVNCGRFPTPLSEYLRFGFYLIKYIPDAYSRRFRLKTWIKDEVQEVDWVSGCYFAIERDKWLKLGGFDEKVFIYYEDADLCLRFHKLGGKVLYYPDSAIKHAGGGFWRTAELKAVSINYQSACYFFRKHRGKFAARLFDILTRITLMVDILGLSVISYNNTKVKDKVKLLIKLLQTKVNL